MSVVHRFTRAVAQAVVAGSFFALASLAHAHAFPKVRTPAADTTVVAPHEVSIEFNNPVEPAFTSITVADAHGNTVSTGKSAVDAKDPRHVSVAVGDLASGAYTVAWIAVAEDGHRTQGHYVFNVK